MHFKHIVLLLRHHLYVPGIWQDHLRCSPAITLQPSHVRGDVELTAQQVKWLFLMWKQDCRGVTSTAVLFFWCNCFVFPSECIQGANNNDSVMLCSSSLIRIRNVIYKVKRGYSFHLLCKQFALASCTDVCKYKRLIRVQGISAAISLVAD